MSVEEFENHEETTETSTQDETTSNDSQVETTLFNSKKIVVTPLLVLLNVIIYLWMLFTGVDWIDPDMEDLIHWGANADVLFAEGEYWRLLSSCFVHVGLIHLVMNMGALLYVGSYLERVIGHWRFLLAYLVTGLISSLVSTWWNDNLLSAGASGAVFGMFGVFIALLLSHKVIKEGTRKEMLIIILFYVGYNLVYGLTDEVDNAAHIGGLLSGLVMGALYIYTLSQSPNAKLFSLEWGIPAFLLIGMFTFAHYFKGPASHRMQEMELYDQIMSISERADVWLEYSDEGSFKTHKKEMEAYKLHIDSCLVLIHEYYTQTDASSANPYFGLLEDYFRKKIEFNEAILKYEKSGFSSIYLPQMDSLSNELDEIIETIDNYNL